MISDKRRKLSLRKKQKRKIDSSLIITSARKLEKSEIELIKSKFPKNIEFKLVVDESIIGGVVIKTGTEYFDGSVDGQLNELRKKLLK